MKISLGTTSEEKKLILESVLKEDGCVADIFPQKVESLVADQPLSEIETITGAKNRALNAWNFKPDTDIGLGLEGGLVMIGDLFYLVCVAVIYKNPETYFMGISSKLALPKEVSLLVEHGSQFGEVIRAYQSQNVDDKKLVALAEKLINRKEAFTEAIRNSLNEYGCQNHY